MYLRTVLQTLTTKQRLEAEDLYKLNEATFNVPEEESIDKIAPKIFSAVEKTVAAYGAGRYDQNDNNFYYDYIALLGTMQNQHFFSPKQNQMLLSWLKEALGAGAAEDKATTQSKAEQKAFAKLQEQNRILQEEMAKLKELGTAIQTLRTIPLPEATGGKSKRSGGKAGGKSKETKAEAPAPEASADPARKELKAQINATGRALAKKKREVIDKHGVEASEALDHEEVKPLLERLKELKARYHEMKPPEDGAPDS